MAEVTAVIQFTRPCLGNVRRPDFDRMQRDQDDVVIFMATWWRSAFLKAAKAINRYYDHVDKIHPALQVYGKVSRIKRRYGKDANQFKAHEGFDTGTIVEASFLIPANMSIDEFIELMRATGLYIGVSPYGWKTGAYGHFKLLEVRKGGSRNNTKSGQPAPDHSGNSGCVGAGA